MNFSFNIHSFQPELRKALEQIGASGFSSVTGLLQTKSSDDRLSPQDANEIAEACVKMAEVKTGALIVIERNVSICSKAFLSYG